MLGEQPLGDLQRVTDSNAVRAVRANDLSVDSGTGQLAGSLALEVPAG